MTKSFSCKGIINHIYQQTDRLSTIAISLVLAGCASASNTNTTVHTFGSTIDIADFKGVIELNTGAISGELKNNSLLRLNVEENIAKAFREKYKNMGSYSVFLMTATTEELQMNNHKALRERGYTHLLVAAINPEKIKREAQNKSSDHTSSGRSMSVSCTIFQLTDGMPISQVNADVYKIGKNYWGRKATSKVGTISKRWQLGPIYSCDQALHAVINFD